MFDSQHHSDFDIEGLIRDARNYVRPGELLRARILEQVTQRRERRRLWQRLFGGVVFSSAVAALLLVVGQIGLRVTPHGRSASDIHDQAAKRASVEGIGWEWALTEVIYDWRRPPSSSSNAASGHLNLNDAGGQL